MRLNWAERQIVAAMVAAGKITMEQAVEAVLGRPDRATERLLDAKRRESLGLTA